MKVVFGLKAHSGWAALVVIGKQDGELIFVDRRRIDLVDELWAKQPYHAAENLKESDAHKLVTRGISAAHRVTLREMRKLLKREADRGNDVVSSAVLVGSPMPDWSIAEILAVHFRMHKAEGVLFPAALIEAGQKCGVPTLAIFEKQLMQQAVRDLRSSDESLLDQLRVLGKTAGPPWGRDQKSAALAAMIGFQFGTGENLKSSK